jgi:hypothetical protein
MRERFRVWRERRAEQRRGPSGVAVGVRRVRDSVAAAVRLVTGLIALLIVIGIAFVVLKANKDNSIVNWVHDAAKFFVGPFDGMFEPKDHKLAVGINWGIAAALYAFVGSVIAGLVAGRRVRTDA